MIYLWLPLLFSLFPILLILGVVLLVRYLRSRDGRRSPLTGKLLHGPGEQLRQRLEKNSDELDITLQSLIVTGPLMISMWALSRLDWTTLKLGIGEFIGIAFLLAALVWAIRRTVRLMTERRHLRDGLQGELMTAQILQELAAHNCVLFHDIPADGFNLDHVVIGPHAVFMVETKSRRKSGNGVKSAHVQYDGKTLRFPDHIDSKPIEQARRQARWLTDFLRSATGDLVPVVPVVALPGWYVDSGPDAHRSDVLVINPRMQNAFTDRRNGSALSSPLRTRVAHALIQRYPALP